MVLTLGGVTAFSVRGWEWRQLINGRLYYSFIKLTVLVTKYHNKATKEAVLVINNHELGG